MTEPLFYRAILTGFFQEQKDKNDISFQDILQILTSFCGTQPEKRRYIRLLYGMENQAIFGYGIKLHYYKAFTGDLLKILSEKSYIEYIGQRTVIQNHPELAAYQCSEIEAGDVPESLWNALGYIILKREESSEETLYFNYTKNIEILCELTDKNNLSIEIIISEASINELNETVEKFVNLFDKSFEWDLKKSLDRFSISEEKK